MKPLYSVGTWDMDLQAYTPQEGLTVPSQNVDIHGLRRALKELRRLGYSCHYCSKRHWDNDCAVLVERTDGRPLDGRR